MGLGKWAALAGGIAGTVFTGNPAFAMAGVSAYNALGNKEAADKAVGQQQTATNQALAANDKALGGYVSRGNTAGDTLMGLMGLGPLPGQAGFGGQAPSAPQSPVTPPPMSPNQAMPDPSDAEGRRNVPAVQNPDTFGDSPASLAALGSRSSYQTGGMQRMSGGIAGGSLMRSPDGRVVMVPPDKMAEAMQNGGVKL
jgi:hypothetical protein